MSNVTEATNYPTVANTPSIYRRRRRREPTFITRWTFDNSRQRAAAVVQYEMSTFSTAGEM